MPNLPESTSLTELGGVKTNFLLDEIDPSCDVGADTWNALVNNVAMSSRMQPRARVSWTGHATTPVLVAWEAVWKGATATAPVLGKFGTGGYTITFPTTVQDELANVHSLNFQDAHGSARGATVYDVQAYSVSANAVTMYVFNNAGTAVDAAGVQFVAWIY